MGGSMKTALLSGLLGTVLGALGMWLATHGFTASPADGPAVTPAGVAGEASKADRPGPIAVPETPPRLEGRSTPGGPHVDTAPFAAAIRSLVLETPKGHGTITGHVRTKDGAPVEGAVIRTMTWRRSPSGGRRGIVPPVPPLEETVRDLALGALWSAALQREARTDREGAYALTDLADLTYSLGSWAVGYQVRIAGRGRGSDLRPGASVDFEASPVVTVPLTVLLPDGAPAAEANVRWSLPKGGGGGGAWWTQDDPLVDMEPGTWSVVAEVGEEMRSRPITVTAGPASEPSVLRLEARNAIEGTVRFDAADRDWAYVFLAARRRGAPAGEVVRGQNARPPDWSFRFPDLAPGDYDVSVALAEAAPLRTETVHVGGGTVTMSLVIPRLSAANFLEARIFGPDGQLMDADELGFVIMEKDVARTSGLGARWTRRADGTFLIALTSHRAMMRERESQATGPDGPRPEATEPPATAAVRWYLQANSKTHGSKEAEFVFGVTPRVEIRFDRSEGR